MTENSDNYLRTYRSTETANTILGITLEAGKDVSLRNTSVISGEGNVDVTAGGNVSITQGETESRDEYGIKYKESGFLSKKTTTIKSDDYHKGVTGSLISGEEVTIRSGSDTDITASAVIGQKDTAITAGGSVNIGSAEEIDRSAYEKQVKKSGLLIPLIFAGYFGIDYLFIAFGFETNFLSVIEVNLENYDYWLMDLFIVIGIFSVIIGHSCFVYFSVVEEIAAQRIGISVETLRKRKRYILIFSILNVLIHGFLYWRYQEIIPLLFIALWDLI